MNWLKKRIPSFFKPAAPEQANSPVLAADTLPPTLDRADGKGDNVLNPGQETKDFLAAVEGEQAAQERFVSNNDYSDQKLVQALRSLLPAVILQKDSPEKKELIKTLQDFLDSMNRKKTELARNNPQDYRDYHEAQIHELKVLTDQLNTHQMGWFKAAGSTANHNTEAVQEGPTKIEEVESSTRPGKTAAGA